MKDLFLPLGQAALEEQASNDDSPGVGDVLTQIDALKDSVSQATDQEKLLALSQNVHNAILKMVRTPVVSKPAVQTETQSPEETLRRDLLFLYAVSQKSAHFQKLTTYFPTVKDFLRAPIGLLKAHGIDEKNLQVLMHPERQKKLMRDIEQLSSFMKENRWHLMDTQQLSWTHRVSRIDQVLPAGLLFKGPQELLHRSKIAIMGDKHVMPQEFGRLIPQVIELFKQYQIVPVCNLVQQSSLQFALQCVRAGLPCLFVLGFDPYKASERSYRYLHYFLDHGCLVLTSDLPFSKVRTTYLYVFKLAMHLAESLLMFPKFDSTIEMADYSSRYWPVLSHCHQEDKVSLWFTPESYETSVPLRHLSAQDSAVALYENTQVLKQFMQGLVNKGYLNSKMIQDVLGSLTNITVIQ